MLYDNTTAHILELPYFVLLIVRDASSRLKPLRQVGDGETPAAPYGDEANPEAEDCAGDCHRGRVEVQHMAYYHHGRADERCDSIKLGT